MEKQNPFNVAKIKPVTCIRIRPNISQDYKAANLKAHHAIPTCLQVKSDGQTIRLQKDSLHTKDYRFDHVFDAGRTQTEVYNVALKPTISDFVSGYNGTAIAYGHVLSGSTYTMFGSETKLGLVHFAVNDIFDAVSQLEEQELVAKVYVSFYQVYMEHIYDLLVPEEIIRHAANPLSIRDEVDQLGVYVENLMQFYVRDRATAFEVIKQGMLNKKLLNSTGIRSSKSHVICQIFLDSEDTPENGRFRLKRRTLTIADLASYERTSAHKPLNKKALQESNIINKSLTAFGNCMSAISSQEKAGIDFVPFRDSKLTRLLERPLCLNAKISIIATICACQYAYEDILSCLKFATRIKLAKNQITKKEYFEVAVKMPEHQQFGFNYDDDDEEVIDNDESVVDTRSTLTFQSRSTGGYTPTYSSSLFNQHDRDNSDLLLHFDSLPRDSLNDINSNGRHHPSSAQTITSGGESFSLREFLRACTLTNRIENAENRNGDSLSIGKDDFAANTSSRSQSPSLYSRLQGSIRQPSNEEENRKRDQSPSLLNRSQHQSHIQLPNEQNEEERLQTYSWQQRQQLNFHKQQIRQLQLLRQKNQQEKEELSHRKSTIESNHGNSTRRAERASWSTDDSSIPGLSISNALNVVKENRDPLNRDQVFPSIHGEQVNSIMNNFGLHNTQTSDNKYQSENGDSESLLLVDRGTQTFSLIPSLQQRKAYDGTLDDFTSDSNVYSVDKSTNTETCHLLPDSQDLNFEQLLELVSLDPLEIAYTVLELRQKLQKQAEEIKYLQELVLTE